MRTLVDFFMFERMWTVQFVRIAFFLIVVGTVIAIWKAFEGGALLGFTTMAYAILSLIFTRIVLEFVVVAFAISDTLTDIKQGLAAGAQKAAVRPVQPGRSVSSLAVDINPTPGAHRE